MKVFFFLILLLNFSDLSACSCATLTKLTKEEIISANNVFIGKVVSVDSFDNTSRKVIFQISERLKTDSLLQITIYTGKGGADCGLSIKEGEKWYIFTYSYNNHSWASLCGRSALLSEHSISPNSINHKYHRLAVRNYKRNKHRAESEIQFIRKTSNSL